ncbi:MAG: hypothetical protein JXB50_07220 [Spirochaetes bacterium]|nr:hypothetical protein [Spirochaetota bacterium]
MYINNFLHIKNNIININKRGSFPYYIYDKKIIEKNCDDLLSIPYKNKSIHFALMANDNPELLRIVKKKGIKVFVNSFSHMRLVQKLNFNSKEIIFVSSAIDERTMKAINKNKITVCLDSINQISQWQKLFPEDFFGIRCNIGKLVKPKKTRGGYFLGKDSRLGLELDELKKYYNNPNVNGLHLYIGTDIADIDYFINCYRKLSGFVKYFPNLEYLDFGGGFGLSPDSNDKFDFSLFGRKVADLMNWVSDEAKKSIKLILEPGRIVAGEAGHFICKIIDIKIRNKKQLIGVNASSSQFPRPLFYPDSAFHPVSILSQNFSNKKENIISSIYGCSTYSRDFLARNIKLSEPLIGDIIIISCAGAYSASSFTTFLGFEKPKEYFV